MNPTQAKFQDDLETIATQLDIGVRSGKFSWRDVQERLRLKSGELATSTNRYVREYAWTSVALAAALGVCIGILIPRR